MALAPGATLGAYRIIEPLGRGGMASVYKAYEASLDRYVALKVLPGEFLHDETFAERFRREARVVARLEHPSIIPIFAFGIEQGMPWMAMRLVSGGTLSGLLRQGRLASPRATAILRGVAEALDYAHGRGVVHRDVKPQNVLLDDAERVYLADFGVARMLEGSSALTQTGMISGTPQYMAPEQAVGTSVDHRADIYALGIVAYEMLTGHVPFSADTPVAVLIKHVQEPMPLPASNEFPETLVRPLMKATAKSPDDRWPTALAFVQALEAGLDTSGITARDVGSATSTLSALPASARSEVGIHSSARQPTLVPLSGVRAAPQQTLAPPTVVSGPPRRGAGLPVAIAAGALAMLLGGGAVAYWMFGRPATEVAPATAIVAEPPPAAPVGAPPAPRSGGATAAAAETASAARTAPAAPAHIPESGRLAIDFEHGLKSGRLQVWVDERPVLNEALDSRVTKKVIGLTKRKGRLDRELLVNPGSHTIRVEVAWDDNRKTKSIVGSFKAGSTRRLEASVGGLRKSLSLEWK